MRRSLAGVAVTPASEAGITTAAQLTAAVEITPWRDIRRRSTMVSRRSALVVARPSPLRDGLSALLWTMPSLRTVHQADNLPSAVQAMAMYRPNLMLVDSDLPGGEAWALLRQVMKRWPQTRCVVMTDSLRSTKQAEAAGASQVLPKGYPAARLSNVLEQLLQH